MDIRPLSPGYAVSPQIDPSDAAAIRDAGFTLVINNRPDYEIEPGQQDAVMRQAIEAAGLSYVSNPITSADGITEENVQAQRAAIEAAGSGRVLAYCASGNRSSIVWARAMAGTATPDALIAAAARHGYNLERFRALLSGA
ncbi:MAG: TIGR01244 family sulfur transferase [Rhodobacteraceae bacterium]|nr:TIGR01244 family sulfur transferase [Paracoccaceae bacterium]